MPLEHPAWAEHICEVLAPEFGKMKAAFGDRAVALKMWCDCCGFATEMESWLEIERVLSEKLDLKVKIEIFCACDKEKHVLKFVGENFNPRHTSGDMKHRNFTNGTFHDNKSNIAVDLPREGIDIYVCCFPCTPWSARGRRGGFDDPESWLCQQMFDTIAFLKPSVFYIENVGNCFKDPMWAEAKIRFDAKTNGQFAMLEAVESAQIHTPAHYLIPPPTHTHPTRKQCKRRSESS